MTDLDLDSIIKGELMRDIEVEASDPTKGKKVKVYGKIGGIVNLGRTYFTTKREVFDKDEQVQTEMAQKYGKEMYGLSGQLKGQSSSSSTNAGASGKGDNLDQNSGLIRCNVSTFLVVPNRGFMKEAGGQESAGYSAYENAWKKYQEYVEKQTREWQNNHHVKQIHDLRGEILKLKNERNNNEGAGGQIKKKFDAITKIFQSSPWKEDMKSKDGSVKNIVDGIMKGYDSWVKNGDDTHGKSTGKQDAANAGDNVPEDEWNPNLTFKINIQTNFDANWYKRKFKSGLLNKAIMAIKTDARSRQQSGSMAGHKYTADEMLPQDERKLDSISWKMTNKVAKDYISMLLGWSRDKIKIVEGESQRAAPEAELKPDSGFGKQMADKALNNRGILGRMKQKLFSGQQNSNTIQVVFQLADPNDGWKVVEQKEEGDKEEPKKEEEPKQEQPKKEEPKKQPEPKKQQPQPKKEQPKKPEPKKQQQPKQMVDKQPQPKKEEPKKEEPKQEVKPEEPKKEENPRIVDVSMYKIRPHKSQSEFVKPGTPSENAMLPHGTDFGTENQVDVYNQKFEKGEQQGKADINKDLGEIEKKVQDAASRVGSNRKHGNDKKNNKAYIGNTGWMNGYADGADVELKYKESTLKLREGDLVFESDRYKLVKDICQTGEGIDELIDNCLIGKLYN